MTQNKVTGKPSRRTRIGRNEDGSLDELVIMLDPDLMLHAEEMDDGRWWVGFYDTNSKDDPRTMSIDFAQTGTKRKRKWEAQIGEDDMLTDRNARG